MDPETKIQVIKQLGDWKWYFFAELWDLDVVSFPLREFTIEILMTYKKRMSIKLGILIGMYWYVHNFFTIVMYDWCESRPYNLIRAFCGLETRKNSVLWTFEISCSLPIFVFASSPLKSLPLFCSTRLLVLHL